MNLFLTVRLLLPLVTWLQQMPSSWANEVRGVASDQHGLSNKNNDQMLRGNDMKKRILSNKEHIKQYSNARKDRKLSNGPITFPVKLGFNDQDFHGDLLSGFKLNNDGNPYKDNVFVFNKTQIKVSYNPKQTSKTKYIQTTEDLEKFMEIETSVKGRYGFVSFSASARYIQENLSSLQQIVIRHQTRRYAYSTELDLVRYELEPTEWVQSNLPDDIAEKYGTSFITKIIWGAQLDVKYSFLSSYQSNVFDIAAEAGLDIDKGGFKLETKADFKLFQNRTKSSLQLRIETDSIGGNHKCPSTPSFTDVIFDCIDDFNESFTALMEEMQKKGNIDLDDVNNNFVPVAFVIGDIDEHINQRFKKEELEILSDMMSNLGRMFYETIGLKAQLESKVDLQKRLFDSSAHYLSTIIEPYEDETNRMLKKIDNKLQEFLDFRRKPFHDIVRSGSTLPTKFPEDEKDEDIINGLLGKIYLPGPVTIGKTSFANFYFEGFAILSTNGSMKPWMSGKLFWNTNNQLAASGASLDDLEVNGWFADELRVMPNAYSFDFVRYGHPIYLQSNVKSEAESRYPYLSNDVTGPTVDFFLEGNDGLWSFQSESSSSDQKHGKCLRYGDTVLIKMTPTSTDEIGDEDETNEGDEAFAQGDKWLGYFPPDKNERFYLPKGDLFDNSFFLIPAGKKTSCPPGYDINTLDLCKEIGVSIGGSLTNGKVVVGHWGHTPCGCFLWEYLNQIHYDDGSTCATHGIYGATICRSPTKNDPYLGKRDDTYDGELTRTSIEPGLSLLDFSSTIYYRSLMSKQRKCNDGHEIDTVELCKDAGITVGGDLRDEKVVVGHWGYTPCGCFVWDQRDLHYDNGSGCVTSSRGHNVCQFPKEDGADQLKKGAQWTIRGENHKNSDDECVQMHSKVYLQNKEYKNLYLNMRDEEVDVGAKDVPAHSLWTFQNSTTHESRDDNEGYVCGAVKAKAKWIPVGQSGKQPYEIIINGRHEIPSTWEQTSGWEQSVVNSIAVGLKVSEEEVKQIYASLLAHRANEAFALGDRIQTNYDVSQGKQAWQFIYDITDVCVGSESPWELNVHEMVTTSSMKEYPCCLPGLAMNPLEPHGPCKFSSPCFCDESICNTIVDVPTSSPTNIPATSPTSPGVTCPITDEARLATAIERASVTIDKALTDFAAEVDKIQKSRTTTAPTLFRSGTYEGAI